MHLHTYVAVFFFFFFAVTVTWAPLTVSVFHDNVLNYDRQNSSAVFWPKYKLHNQWPFCHLLIMQYLMLNTMSHWSFWIGANDSFKSQESDYETHKRLHVLATYSHCRLCVHTPSNVLTYNVQSRAKVCGPKVPRFFFFFFAAWAFQLKSRAHAYVHVFHHYNVLSQFEAAELRLNILKFFADAAVSKLLLATVHKACRQAA